MCVCACVSVCLCVCANCFACLSLRWFPTLAVGFRDILAAGPPAEPGAMSEGPKTGADEYHGQISGSDGWGVP